MFLRYSFAALKCTRPSMLSNCFLITSRTCTGKYVNYQMEYLESVLQKDVTDWSSLKNEVLTKNGSMNNKNYEGTLLKFLVKRQQLELALSFAEYLRATSDELSLGSINGLFTLYYEASKLGKLDGKDKEFILMQYNNLYSKYKVLDATTSEKLLHALCAIGEYEKCFKILDDICLLCTPSHATYSIFISTLFDHDREADAHKLIAESINNKRPLQDNVYDSWIMYIFRRYSQKKALIKQIDKICENISKNLVTVSETTANLLKKTYTSLGYKAHFARMKKETGQCFVCQQNLDYLGLSDHEFTALQSNIKSKILETSDLFLKSSPKEIMKFKTFIDTTGPYDIVLDALNIAYTSGKANKVNGLLNVVEYFMAQNKKILLLGRQHMLGWNKKSMQFIMKNTYNFFTDDLSQDDPFFITAAILSGPQTDFVSLDLLRGHKFLLKDEVLRQLFQRWQWQHQWKISYNYPRFHITKPLSYTPCAQQKNGGWHLPYKRDNLDTKGKIHDGMPDMSSWLCIQPSK